MNSPSRLCYPCNGFTPGNISRVGLWLCSLGWPLCPLTHSLLLFSHGLHLSAYSLHDITLSTLLKALQETDGRYPKSTCDGRSSLLRLPVGAGNGPDLGYLPSRTSLWTSLDMAYCPGLASLTLHFVRHSHTLPICQSSSAYFRRLPLLSFLTNSPHLLLQTKRCLSSAYSHIQTSATAEVTTLLSKLIALLAVNASFSVLKAIARTHTQNTSFIHSHQTYDRKLPLSKKIALHIMFTHPIKFQLPRVQITRLSIL